MAEKPTIVALVPMKHTSVRVRGGPSFSQWTLHAALPTSSAAVAAKKYGKTLRQCWPAAMQAT